MNLKKSSLEEIRNLRKQKLRELLFPSLGARHERILYGGNVVSFFEGSEDIGYYISRNDEILDFYVKKEFDYLADECFSFLLENFTHPVVYIRSDDSLLINLVFNYLIDLEKGGYLFVRDKRHILPEYNNQSLSFEPLSIDTFEDAWRILSREETLFYDGCDPSQKDIFKNFIGKDMFYSFLEDGKVVGVGYNQLVRNNCAELSVIIDRDCRGRGYGTLLLSSLVKLVEERGYQGFSELPKIEDVYRKMMEKLGFYVIAKHFIARIKGKIEDSSMKRRSRRYSLTGLFRVL